jgi:hypothetical protein
MPAGPTWALLGVPSGPATSLIFGSCCTSLHKSPFDVGLNQRTGWSGLGSMGPLSWTWSPPTDLGTNLLLEFQHVPLLQPPLGASQHRRIKRRWNGGPPNDQGPQPTSWLPTNTLLPPYTINRGSGARWRSAPLISKLSRLLHAPLAQ